MAILRTKRSSSPRGRRLPLPTLLLVASALGGAPLNAAGPADPWETPFLSDAAALRAAADARPAPEDADAEILFKEAAYVCDARGRCTFRQRTVIRILSESAIENWAEISREWAPWFEERPELRARVVSKDGTVHELDPKTIAEGPAGDPSADIYTDRRVVRAPLPSLDVGSVIEEQFEVRERQPQFEAGSIHRTYMRASVPIARARITLEAPASLKLTWRVRGLPEKDVRSEESGGVLRLSFEGGPFPIFEGWEPGMPRGSTEPPSFAFTTGTSWQEVASRYAAIVDTQIAKGPAPATAPASPSGSDAAAPAWKRLTAALHRKVRYTGVEFGDAAIVPAPPAETLKRGYGDCKDKAALLVAQLRAAGLPASIALLSAGYASDVDEELPGLGNFNHAIVVIESEPRIWIDATDQYGSPGLLPEADQDRPALIASGSSRELVRTPRAGDADNGLVQTSEFFLQERGPSKVTATFEPRGDEEREYRETYHQLQRKDLEQNLENMASVAYLAKKVGKFEYSDPLDFSRPFRLKVEIPEAPRGVTMETEAGAALLPALWISTLPSEFLNDPAADKPEDEKEKEERRRHHDYVWDRPFTAEWRYRVVPPDGFAAAGLPESGTRALGTATLAQEYRVEPDGSVAATVRLSTGKPRITPAEFETLRSEALAVSRANAIFLRFESVPARQLAAGNIREALTEYRRLAAAHPKEALHQSQLARALLQAGLGEAARRQARLATEIEKDSAHAQGTLGWVLQHDLLGRRFKPGYDRTGAVAAYRKAERLDPKNMEMRADLAILLEHDAEGERYADPGQVKEAIVQYEALRKDLDAKQFDHNLLVAMVRAGEYAKARTFAAGLPAGANRDALLLAAVGASEGADAALKEADRLASDAGPRRQAIENAARLLIVLRAYPPAARLLAEAARGAEKPGALLTQSDLMKRIRRWEEIPMPPGEPATAVKRLFVIVATRGQAGGGSLVSLFSRAVRPALDAKAEEMLMRGFRTAMSSGDAGVPVIVALDASLSILEVSADGSDAVGYRLRVGGAQSSFRGVFYVAKEDGEYRFVSMDTSPPELGTQVLAHADAGNLPAARQWLDWAREGMTGGRAEDPLGGALLPRFWTKGSDGGADEIRTAGAVLLCGSAELAAPAVPILREAATRAKDDASRLDLLRAQAQCDASTKNWADLKRRGSELLAAHPDSDEALRLSELALGKLEQWDEAERLVKERLAREPDDLEALQLLSYVQLGREDYAGLEKSCLKLVDEGKARPGDYNNLAWNSLFTGGATLQAVEWAQRAVSLNENRDPGSLHTLATLYAALGRSVQARETLLESMDRKGKDEPDENDWYVLGQIAENYGETATAREDYRRVVKPVDSPLGGSTFLLAQKRLAELGPGPPTPKKTGR